MKKLILRIIECIKTFLGINHIEYFDVMDEYEDYVAGQDLKIRNTLVGSVRSVRQYEVNYEELFYHIPEGYIADPKEIEYVALYRSKKLFGKENAGIVHYGKVVSWDLTERSNITELPSEYNTGKYYRFKVSEWFTLKNPVKPRESWPHVCILTNKFLLETSKYINQLILSNNEEFKLYYALYDITHGIYDGFFVEDTKIRVRRSEILLVSSNFKKRYKISEFNSAPVGTTKMIFRDIYGDYSQP